MSYKRPGNIIHVQESFYVRSCATYNEPHWTAIHTLCERKHAPRAKPSSSSIALCTTDSHPPKTYSWLSASATPSLCHYHHSELSADNKLVHSALSHTPLYIYIYKHTRINIYIFKHAGLTHSRAGAGHAVQESRRGVRISVASGSR